MGADEDLIAEIRRVLVARADPERAAGQQAYMKSTLPYHGLTSPTLRTALRPVLAAHRLPDADAWRAAISALWDGATHREEWYAAIAVWRHRFYRTWATEPAEASLALLRHLVVTGAWWDVVDELAQHGFGPILAAHRATLTPVARAWSREENLWLRRVAIIGQNPHRAATDTNLLAFAIEGSIDDRDFFARKAIGWALREYAKTDPAWVGAYVRTHADRLSALSVREATKHLPHTAGTPASPPARNA